MSAAALNEVMIFTKRVLLAQSLRMCECKKPKYSLHVFFNIKYLSLSKLIKALESLLE